MEAVLAHVAAMIEAGLITQESTIAELFALRGHEQQGLGTPGPIK